MKVVSKKSIRDFLKKIIPLQMVFLMAMPVLYLVLWRVSPEKTVVAIQGSIDIFYHVLGPLCLVFLLMIGLNLVLKPVNIVRFLRKETTIKMRILTAIAGIISAGPIYAWYPILKDLREKGAKHSLFAIFLVNRAVKPFLLPVMISIFGWVYVVFLTIFIIAGSFFVGFIVAAFLDSPTVSLRQGEG